VEFFTFDKAYIERLREGDPSTEQHFVAYFEQLLRIKLRARMLASDQIEDLRQETFIRVITSLRKDGGIRHPERFVDFVNSICNKVLQEFYRYSAKNQPMEDAHMEIPDKVLDLEGMLVTKQSAEQVRRILDAMPKRDRDLLRAIFLEEKDKNTICREFGVDRNYLDLMIRRTKRKFQSPPFPIAEQDPDTGGNHHANELPGAKEAPSATQASGSAQARGNEQVPSSEQVSSTGQLPCATSGEPNHTTTPPGAVLYSMAEFICSKRTMEEIVTPLLADMQFEHNEAFSAGQKWEAAWIRVRGCWSLFTALGINRLVGLFVRIFLRFSSR
jgi:RNA polymerase sigma-70 factor (ECF subfamily)